MRQFLVPLALLALAACGPKPAEPAAAEAATPTEATPTASVDENTPVQVSKVPRPAWAPDYPGSPPRTAPVAIVTNGVADATFEFSTSDTPEQVVAFYRGKAEAAGLGSRAATNVAPGVTAYVATGPDGERLSVGVTPDGGQSHVTVTWNVPEK